MVENNMEYLLEELVDGGVSEIDIVDVEEMAVVG